MNDQTSTENRQDSRVELERLVGLAMPHCVVIAVSTGVSPCRVLQDLWMTRNDGAESLSDVSDIGRLWLEKYKAELPW